MTTTVSIQVFDLKLENGKFRGIRDISSTVFKDSREGYGIMEYKNGNIYDGNWLNNQKSGLGKMIFSSNMPSIMWTYYGEWKNNLFNGLGLMKYSKYRLYKGNWLNGKRDGYGKMIMNNVTYEGNWSDNFINGKGKLIIDDKIFEGIFTGCTLETETRPRTSNGRLIDGFSRVIKWDNIIEDTTNGNFTIYNACSYIGTSKNIRTWKSDDRHYLSNYINSLNDNNSLMSSGSEMLIDKEFTEYIEQWNKNSIKLDDHRIKMYKKQEDILDRLKENRLKLDQYNGSYNYLTIELKKIEEKINKINENKNTINEENDKLNTVLQNIKINKFKADEDYLVSKYHSTYLSNNFIISVKRTNTRNNKPELENNKSDKLLELENKELKNTKTVTFNLNV